MRMSPDSRWGKSSAMVASTTAAGTINQTARGLSSFFMKSRTEEAPTAFSLTSASTAWGVRSKTTHWWPARRSRRTMLAPIRPRPIMPSCIKVTLRFEVFPDQDVSHARLECAQEIVPVVGPYDKQAVLERPLDAVQDDAVVQWFDERIVGFVKAYLALGRGTPRSAKSGVAHVLVRAKREFLEGCAEDTFHFLFGGTRFQ